MSVPKDLLFIGTTTLLLAFCSSCSRNQEPARYRDSVLREARRRGMNPDEIQYPEHWPLDFYQRALQNVTTPESVEVLAADAESVGYFISPLSNRGPDSALVQVLYFRIADRVNSVQVLFPDTGHLEIQGGDWLPAATYRSTREGALSWWHRIQARRRDERPISPR